MVGNEHFGVKKWCGKGGPKCNRDPHDIPVCTLKGRILGATPQYPRGEPQNTPVCPVRRGNPPASPRPAKLRMSQVAPRGKNRFMFMAH